MPQYHSRKAPILNPFDQLSAPAFDSFVTDVTTAIRNALNPPVTPVPRRAAVRMPGFGSPTPERSSAVSTDSAARDVEVIEIDDSDQEEEEEEEELVAYSRGSVSSGPSQLQGFSNLPSGSSPSGDITHLEGEDLAQWISDDEEIQQKDEEQEGQEQEQEEEEQEEQEDGESRSSDDYFVRQGSVSSDSNVSIHPPMSNGNAKGKARAIDEGPGVQALQGISERLHSHPELFAVQSSSEDGDEDDELDSDSDNEEHGGEYHGDYVRQRSSEYSYHNGSPDWDQEDENRSFAKDQDEQESEDDDPLPFLPNDPNQPIEVSDSEDDESEPSYPPVDRNARSRSTSMSEFSGGSYDVLEEEQSKDAGAFASHDLGTSRVVAHISPQAVAYSHLMVDYNDTDEESDPDGSVQDENVAPYDEQDWSGNGPLRGMRTADFAFADTNNEDEDEDGDVEGEGEFGNTGGALNGGSAGYQVEYRSPNARVAGSPITSAPEEEALRGPTDQGAEDGDASHKVVFPDPNLPPPPTDLITPDIVHNSGPGYQDTSISNIAQPSATPLHSEKLIQSLPGYSFDADDTGIPSFDMFRAIDQQMPSRSRSPEIDIFDLETPGEPGESLIEDIYIASHGHDESTPSTSPGMELAPVSPVSGMEATLSLPSEHHTQHPFISTTPASATTGLMHSTATVVNEPAIPSAASPHIPSNDNSSQMAPESIYTYQPGARADDVSVAHESALDVTDGLAVLPSASEVSGMPDISSSEAETGCTPSESLPDYSSSFKPADPAPAAVDSLPLATFTSNEEANSAMSSLKPSSARPVSPASSLRSELSVPTAHSALSTNVPSLDKLSQDASFSATSGISIEDRIPTVAPEPLKDAEVLEDSPAENPKPIPAEHDLVSVNKGMTDEAIPRKCTVGGPDRVLAAEVIDEARDDEKIGNHEIPSAARQIETTPQYSLSDAEGELKNGDPGVGGDIKQSTYGASDFDIDNAASMGERSPRLAALDENPVGNTNEQEWQVEPNSTEAVSAIVSDNSPTPRASSPISRNVDDDGLFDDDISSQSGAHAIGGAVNDASSAASSPREGTPIAKKRKRRTSLLVDEASPARNTRSRTKESSDRSVGQDSLPSSPASTSSWVSDENRRMTLSGQKAADQPQRTQRGSSLASAASVSGVSQQSSPRPYVLVPRPQIHHHRTTSTPGVSGVNRTAPNNLVIPHVTRSQCRFHKISTPGLTPDEVVHFVVPYCSLSATDIMKEEGIIDCGLASDEDNRNKITDVSNLDAALASVLRKLVGPDLMHEEVCGYLPSDSSSQVSPAVLLRSAGSPIPAARRGHKRKSSRLGRSTGNALDQEIHGGSPIAGPSTPQKFSSIREPRSPSQNEELDAYEPSESDRSDQFPKEGRNGSRLSGADHQSTEHRSTPQPHSPKVFRKPYVDLSMNKLVPDVKVEDEDESYESEADDEYRESTPHVGSSESGTPPPVSPSTVSKRSKRKRKTQDSGALPYKPGNDESGDDGSGSDAVVRPKHKRRRRKSNAVVPSKENGLEEPEVELEPAAEASDIVEASASGSSTDGVPVLPQSVPAAGDKPRWAPTSWIPRLW